MSGKRNNGNRGLIILLVCLLLAAAAGGGCLIFFMGQDAKAQQYSQKVRTAKKFMTEENYDAAIKSCEQLIQLDEGEEEGYQVMAEAYIKKKDPMAALRVYSTGYKATGEQALLNAYEDLQENMWSMMGDTGKKEDEDETAEPAETENMEDEELDVEKLAKDMAGVRLLAKFAEYDDSRYVKEFGGHTKHEKTDGSTLCVRYEKLAADVYYKNEWETKTFSEADLLPYSIGKPYLIVLDNVRNIFGTDKDAALSYGDISYLLGRQPEISTELFPEKTVLSMNISSCDVYVECDKEGNIFTGKVWNQILIPQEEEQEDADEVTYYGYLINAVDGNPVENAYVTFTDEDGNTWEVNTNGEGMFELTGPGEGSYEMLIEKEGFITEEKELELTEDEPSLGTFSTSPELDSKEMRIVLEWNELPWDLDSYYMGQYNDGTTVFVSFDHMEDTRNGETAVSLDLDDRDGYGPETITVRGLDGQFEYDVHDYLETGEMGAVSGASVKVYLPDGSIRTFTIPAGEGNVWRVFSVNNGEITEIGTLE